MIFKRRTFNFVNTFKENFERQNVKKFLRDFEGQGRIERLRQQKTRVIKVRNRTFTI